MAYNTIKGLTVEIGGDTTKLGKALESVNKKSRDLSSELGEINKLLKLDPGNADLLAQKQKVLAEAVANTKEKLETLKEAEKQVQKQFERGEVSEEQVRALQREIVATTKKLDGYEKAAKETTDEIEKLGKESDDVEDSTQKVKKGADKAEKALDEYADSAEKAEKSSSGLSKIGGVVGKGLAAVGAAVATAGAALIASAEASREYRREMGKLDTAFTTAGHSSETATKTYKALQGVLGETDQAVEAANHLAKLTDNEKDLQTWTHTLTGVYATFGASLPIEGLTEAANETAKVGKVTGPLADALNWAGVNEDKFNESLEACSNEQERQTLIMETLSGLYDEAADKYNETNAEVIRANQANEEWASAMAEVGGAIEPLLTDVKLLGASLLSDLVPGVKEVTGAFRAMLNGDEGAAANLGEALSGIFSGIMNKITELLLAATEVGINLVTTLASSILMALPQLFNTGTQVVVTLLNGLTSAIPQVLASAQSVVPGLVSSITSSIPLIVQAGVDLLLALGDAVPQVIPLLTQSVGPIVRSVVDGLLLAIPQLLDGAVQFLMAIVSAIPVVCEQLLPQIAPIVVTICDGLISNIDLLLDGALQLLDAILLAIPLLCDQLLPEVPRIVDTLVTKLVSLTPKLLDAAITLFFALVDALPVVLGSLLPELPRLVTQVCNSLVRMSPILVNAAIQLFLGLVKAIPVVVSQLLQSLPSILKTITSVLSGGVKLVFNIGKDLIKGLWNGIKDMTSWITGKIQGFGDSVLSGIKKFFGIKSPSRVFRDQVGKMLVAGMAEGIEANADAPLDAMADLSKGLLGEADGLNGLTLERQINHTFATPTAATAAESGMLGKLDKILAAIERGQILTIDGKALVGATADMTDNALGRRRALVARGAV